MLVLLYIKNRKYQCNIFQYFKSITCTFHYGYKDTKKKTGIMRLNRGMKCKKYLEINTLYINNHATIKKDCVRMSVGQYMFISIYIYTYIHSPWLGGGWGWRGRLVSEITSSSKSWTNKRLSSGSVSWNTEISIVSSIKSSNSLRTWKRPTVH